MLMMSPLFRERKKMALASQGRTVGATKTTVLQLHQARGAMAASLEGFLLLRQDS